MCYDAGTDCSFLLLQRLLQCLYPRFSTFPSVNQQTLVSFPNEVSICPYRWLGTTFKTLR
jgi:hypothetical protein